MLNIKGVRATPLAASLLSFVFAGAAWAGPVGGLTVIIGPDLNGDDKSDQVIENTTSGFSVGRLQDGIMTTASGSVPGTNTAAGFQTAAFVDLDADNTSDKIVENTTTGFSVGFLIDGLTPGASDTIPGTNKAAGYETAGFADVDGDNKTDKIVENTTTGYSVAFLLDGVGIPPASDSGPIPGTNVAAGFFTSGFPDINGDGKSDKVVENTTTGFSVGMLLDGVNLPPASDIQPIPGTNVAAGFVTAGYPDLNGDGKDDKVVENTTTGYSVGFLLDGVNPVPVSDTGPIAATNVAAGFVTAGFPDLNGDGQADKVVENTSTGFTVAFLLDGLNPLLDSGALPGTPTGWVTVGFPDLNGDGKADKVIQETATGNTTAYLLDGLTVLDSGPIGDVSSGFAAIPWDETWTP